MAVRNLPSDGLDRRSFGAVAAGLLASSNASSQTIGPPRGADAGNIAFGPGDHHVDEAMTIAGTLTLAPGARLVLGPAARLVLRGDLAAPAAPVFVGTGTVDLSHSRVLAARPEWWGGVPDDPQVDCAPAIEAALAAHPAVQLGLGDYYLARTLTIERHNARLWGVGRTNEARGTRLLLAGDGGAVVRAGAAHRPASINDHCRGLDLRWLELGRTVAPARGDAAVGLALRYVLDVVVEGLRANEHAIGFSLLGAVRTLVRDCAAFRSLWHGDGAADTFVGFDMDGRDPPISTGANASLYLIDCAARTGRAPPALASTGARLLGAMSDTFLVRFETTALAQGVFVDGGAPNGAADATTALNLHIDTPVLDQCGDTGIVLRDLGAGAMIDLTSPWIALGPGGRAGLLCERTGGAITLSGGQLIDPHSRARARDDATVGLSLDHTSGVAVLGTKCAGFLRPVVMRESSAFDLAPTILSRGEQVDAACDVAASHGGSVRARLVGAVGSYRVGTALDAACRSIAVEFAGLSGALTGVTLAGRAAPLNAGAVQLFPPSTG